MHDCHPRVGNVSGRGDNPLPIIMVTMALALIMVSYLGVHFINKVAAFALVWKKGRVVLWVWFKEHIHGIHDKKKTEPILVEESPLPTKTSSTPRS